MAKKLVKVRRQCAHICKSIPDLAGKLEAQIRDLNDLPPNGNGVVAVKATTENGKGNSPEKAEKGSRRNMALEEELESAEAVV